MNDIEKRILHEVTRSPDAIKRMLEDQISDDFFQFPDAKNLFKIVTYFFKKYGSVVQSDTLQSLFKVSKTLSPDEQGKIAILFEEIKLFPDSSNFQSLLDEFKQYYKVNSIKNSLDKAVNVLHDNDPDKVLTQLKSDLVSIERAVAVKSFDNGYLGDNAEDALAEYLDAKAHPEKYRGVETGYPTIDQITNGLPKDSATIIMGSAKSAKSVLMVNIAYHNFMQGKRVYFHVNEGGKALVERRLACRGAGVLMNDIERRTLSDVDFAKYADFLRACKDKRRIYIDSVIRSSSTSSYIQQKVTDLQVDGPVDLIVIDYMSIMKSEEKGNFQTYEKLGNISKELKDLAMKIKIPVITIMHVNRPGAKDKDKKHFSLEDMGLSYEPGKDVDLVMSWRILNEEDLNTKNTADGNLSIIASRYCKPGEAKLRVDTSHMLIEEYDLSKVMR